MIHVTKVEELREHATIRRRVVFAKELDSDGGVDEDADSQHHAQVQDELARFRAAGA